MQQGIHNKDPRTLSLEEKYYVDKDVLGQIDKQLNPKTAKDYEALFRQALQNARDMRRITVEQFGRDISHTRVDTDIKQAMEAAGGHNYQLAFMHLVMASQMLVPEFCKSYKNEKEVEYVQNRLQRAASMGGDTALHAALSKIKGKKEWSKAELAEMEAVGTKSEQKQTEE